MTQLEQLPFAKPTRIRDRKALKLYSRQHPRCEVNGCRWRPMPEPHHIQPTSLGGPDEDSNLCCLCNLHHIGNEGVHVLGHREWYRRFGARLSDETRKKFERALRLDEAQP